jgi:hypothetical protein
MEREALIRLVRQFPCKELDTGNIRTCPARLSYPNLFEKSKPNGKIKEEKYGATLLFPKGVNLTLLEEALTHTAIEKYGAKWQSLNVALPWRDQAEKEGKAGYVPGAKFFRAKSDQRPGIRGPNGKELTDKNAIYPGCWVLATIRPFPYPDGSPGRGVSFGLQNIMKIADDESFGAMPADPEDEFGDVLIDGSGDADSMFGDEPSSGGKASVDSMF